MDSISIPSVTNRNYNEKVHFSLRMKSILVLLIFSSSAVFSTQSDHITCEVSWKKSNFSCITEITFEPIDQVNLTCGNYIEVGANLTSVNYGCKIAHLEPFMLNITQSKLKKLNVKAVGLKSFDANSFEFATHLVNLDASHNELTEIPAFILSKAPKIRRADFSWNQISYIDPKAFQLPPGTGPSNLKTLNFNINRITSIDELILDDLSALENLYLGYNYIKTIGPEVFASNLNLTNLYLHYNEIITINSQHLKRLKVVFLSHNKITNIPEVFQQLGDLLSQLYVAHNFVGNLNESTFIGFNNLNRLDLCNTSLGNLQPGIFRNLENLQFLDISDNNLMDINISWDDLKNLESVHMAGNKLTHLNGFNRDILTKMQKLTISGNHFECDFLSEFTKQWADAILDQDDFSERGSMVRTFVSGIECYQK